MIRFMKVANDCYVVYVNGKRITDIPLTFEELKSEIGKIKLTDADVLFVNKFYT